MLFSYSITIFHIHSDILSFVIICNCRSIDARSEAYGQFILTTTGRQTLFCTGFIENTHQRTGSNTRNNASKQNRKLEQIQIT